MICYPLAGSDQFLAFTDEVLLHFDKYRQKSGDPEAGGQLFADFHDQCILVVRATGPKSLDHRGRIFFHPNRLLEKIEIHRLYKQGLHFVGDWHTHPQQFPAPSDQDLFSIGDCFRKSQHDLAGFVLVVVGLSNFPEGLYVSIHDGIRALPLAPSAAGCSIPTAKRNGCLHRIP